MEKLKMLEKEMEEAKEILDKSSKKDGKSKGTFGCRK